MEEVQLTKEQRIEILDNVLFDIINGHEKYICTAIWWRLSMHYETEWIQRIFKMNRDTAIKLFHSDPKLQNAWWGSTPRDRKNRIEYLTYLKTIQ